jgi:hypothetical protein
VRTVAVMNEKGGSGGRRRTLGEDFKPYTCARRLPRSLNTHTVLRDQLADDNLGNDHVEAQLRRIPDEWLVRDSRNVEILPDDVPVEVAAPVRKPGNFAKVRNR